MLRKIRKLGSIYSSWILIQTGVLFSENTGDIVITEFSIKPGVDVYQYIEIFNTTDGPIDLKDWEIKAIGIKEVLKVEMTRSIEHSHLTKWDSTTDIKKY